MADEIWGFGNMKAIPVKTQYEWIEEAMLLELYTICIIQPYVKQESMPMVTQSSIISSPYNFKKASIA